MIIEQPLPITVEKKKRDLAKIKGMMPWGNMNDTIINERATMGWVPLPAISKWGGFQ
jgi:hypothetical protein